jgi:formylglycine-generating enzyme required for sulfatase activity
MPDESCPQVEALRDSLMGKLPAEEAEALLDHLDRCRDCQAKLQTVSDADETLIDCLRQPQVRDELWDEPHCQEAVARAKEVGEGPPTRDLGARKGQPEPEIIGELGEYQVLEKLAEGGMGTVYKALHTKLGREVALKVLPTAGSGSEQAIARFEREMKAVAGLDHPHIVRALDAREVEGTRFLVLEYIDGADLSRLVRSRGPLPVVEACRLVLQAAVGLQYAHEHELIHRDVKPSNLIVDQQGRLKILDLGLARFRPAEPTDDEMTRSGQTMGTAEYMAPEQASDTHAVDARADVYGLGCALYYLLVGHAPYPGETAYQIIKAHHESPIPSLRAERPDVPERLDRVFQRMVAKTPAERHASMSEVVADLEECLAEAEALEGSTDPTKAAAAGPEPKWRKPRVVALLAVGALAVLVLLAGLVFRIRTPQGMLVLRVDQYEADVVIDDGKITITTPGDEQPTEIWLKEGDHKLTVSKGGFETRVETFTIRSGQREAVDVKLEPLPTGADTAQAEPPQPSDAVPWTQILPPDAPPPAVAPFDAATAKRHQQAWADYLGVPIEQEIDLSGGEKLTLVLVPPGEFLMGSPAAEQAQFLEEAGAISDQSGIDRIPSEGPQHWVRITKPFAISRHEVTRGQFRRFVEQTGYETQAERDGEGGAGVARTDDYPVAYTTWDDAKAFCQWLSKKQGAAYHLPTEAQWEYACRAGTTTFFHCGDSYTALGECAWFHATAASNVHPVGQLRPNGFGLHDMHGNVWEWCEDWWAKDYYGQSPPDDPGGPATGSHRVARGGARDSPAWGCRSAHRANILPNERYYALGFRLVMVLTEESGK